MSAKGDDKISGLQKAAILLISLGPEKSAAVFKHLKEEEIEELTLEIANTRSVSPQVKEQIINEFYECIFYDDTHLVIRSFSGIESINFVDIEKIKRDFIDGKAVHGGGHWRYTVQIKTKEENTKEIVVPFPQLIHNQHLQDLFLRIKKLNKDVVWVKIES